MELKLQWPHATKNPPLRKSLYELTTMVLRVIPEEGRILTFITLKCAVLKQTHTKQQQQNKAHRKQESETPSEEIKNWRETVLEEA